MRRRQRHKNHLGWALLLSLLINHSVIMPGVYLLLGTEKPAREPEFTEVELVPDVEDPEPEPPELKAKPPRKLRLEEPPRITRAEPKKQQPVPKPKEQPRDKPKVKPPDPLRMKMVEVNNPESESPPEDARFLSDKDRRVEKETRARRTNLVKDQPKPKPTSRPSPRPEPEPGTPDRVVAELRKQQSPTPKVQPPREVSPLLRMRQPTPAAPLAEQKALAQVEPEGALPMPREAPPRPRLDLNHKSLDRIYGQRAHDERELARLSPSRPRGSSHQHKWEQIRSALENFVPEVRPGNQTALGTRAHPFALYIARAHRKIHRLWGFGFLPDLDMKSDSHPMNDMGLWTMVELVVGPEGAINKATIVKPSGLLSFDVAALSTAYTAAPFPRSPRAIRSGDGNVYLHWRFHRNQRQCGTFGVDPYILDKPPEGPIDGDLSEVGKGDNAQTAPKPRRLRKLNQPATASHTGGSASGSAQGGGHPKATSPPQAIPPQAYEQKDAVARTVRSFLERLAAGDARGMAGSCALPFSSGGRQVASSRKNLERMFKDLIKDLGPKSRGGAASVSLMNVMQAREKLGTLPPGAEYGKGMLVGEVELGDSTFTLLLQQEQGTLWRVVGLNR